MLTPIVSATSRGAAAESSSAAGGGFASRSSLAADLVSADEVQALLDGLAPACVISASNGRRCDVPAEWIAWFRCECGRVGNHPIELCPGHYMRAVARGLDSSLSRQHVGHQSWPTRADRIRSKPTK